jgi:hypothetical protein
MTRKLFLLVASFATDPARVRIALFAIGVVVAALCAIAPGMTALAGDMPGGGH